ncbi:MAG: lytic transglycosylase domain-containing protein [Candidatus Aminicenantales bacterium]
MMKKRLFFPVQLIFLLCFIPVQLLSKSSDDLRKEYDPLVRNIAEKHGVDVDLVHSVISAESGYNRYAVSPKGALGLMQLMPETAEDYGVRDLFDPGQNIEGGVKYLKDLIQLFNHKTELALAAYNAGHKAVKKHGKVPPYPETKAFIKRVMASYKSVPEKAKSPIYTFYDKEGKLILTNDFRYYALNKGN